MVDCLRKIALCLVLLSLAGPVHAGDAVPPLPLYVDLLGKVAQALRAVDDSSHIGFLGPGIVDTLAGKITIIESFKNKYSSLGDFKTKAHWSRTEVAKQDLTNDRELNNALDGVMEILKQLRNNPEIDSNTIALWDSLQLYRLHYSQEAGLKKLQRYENKYGPNSAQLNPVEGFLNIIVFQCLPGFKLNSQGPGPLEFISSYSSSYVTAYDAETGKTFDDIGVVSAFEIGLRCYFFGGSWGQQGCKGILKPGYATAGLLITGEARGFFKWPLRGKESYGIFASWGGLKAGYIPGGNYRILLSRQFQLVPYLF
ncbi:hypothetical protein HZA73_03795 [candidate division TA06 bacterium]|nr:hypothetical protein [candidate division TA06 bacterium]